MASGRALFFGIALSSTSGKAHDHIMEWIISVPNRKHMGTSKQELTTESRHTMPGTRAETRSASPVNMQCTSGNGDNADVRAHTNKAATLPTKLKIRT